MLWASHGSWLRRFHSRAVLIQLIMCFYRRITLNLGHLVPSNGTLNASFYEVIWTIQCSQLCENSLSISPPLFSDTSVWSHKCATGRMVKVNLLSTLRNLLEILARIWAVEKVGLITLNGLKLGCHLMWYMSRGRWVNPVRGTVHVHSNGHGNFLFLFNLMYFFFCEKAIFLRRSVNNAPQSVWSS